MKLTNLKTLMEFTRLPFDRQEWAREAALIIWRIMRARSPRPTEIARALPKDFFANHKMIYRFLARVPLKEPLMRLFREDAPFVLADPKTPSQKDPLCGSTQGRQDQGLSAPRPFRSLPGKGHPLPLPLFLFLDHRPRGEAPGTWSTSRRSSGWRSFWAEGPWSWTGSSATPGYCANSRGRDRLRGAAQCGAPSPVHPKGWKGSGIIPRSRRESFLAGFPLPGGGGGERGRSVGEGDGRAIVDYHRFGSRRGPLHLLEESFRDLKGLFGLERLMNKAREHMEGVVALVLMAYAIALLLEEEVRDRVYGARGGVRFILEPSCC